MSKADLNRVHYEFSVMTLSRFLCLTFEGGKTHNNYKRKYKCSFCNWLLWRIKQCQTAFAQYFFSSLPYLTSFFDIKCKDQSPNTVKQRICTIKLKNPAVLWFHIFSTAKTNNRVVHALWTMFSDTNAIPFYIWICTIS